MELKTNVINSMALVLIALAIAGGISYHVLSENHREESDEILVVNGTGRLEDIENNSATFYANIEIRDTDRAVVVNKGNEKNSEVLAKLGTFGLDPKNIKTEYVNIYENKSYDGGISSLGWIGYTRLRITADNMDKAKIDELFNLLNTIDQITVEGPNYGVAANTQLESESQLIELAMKNAKEKAVVMAKSSGRRLGKVMSVSDTSMPTNPITYANFDRAMGGGGGGGDVYSGTESLTKNITVVYELE